MQKDTPSINKSKKYMAKLEKIWLVGVFVAAVGILEFVVAGVRGNMIVASYSIMAAGVFAWIALIALGIQKLRRSY